MQLKKRKFRNIGLVLIPLATALFLMPNASIDFEFTIYPDGSSSGSGSTP